jgi:hypothetical protein
MLGFFWGFILFFITWVSRKNIKPNVNNYHRHIILKIKLEAPRSLKSLSWFSIWHRKLIENGGVTHNFESGPPKDHFNSNFWAKDFDVIFIS